MASGSSSFRPLSVGNVVNTAIRVYGANFKQYIRIAGVATLWGLLPFGVLILLVGMMIAGIAAQAPALILLNLVLWLAWIPLVVFCSTYALVNTAIIARLTYGELIEQPESAQAARDLLTPKKWMFFLTSLLVGLIMLGIQLGTTIVFQYIPMFAVAFTAGAESPLGSLIVLIGNLIGLAIYYWFFARWFIPDALLAIEPTIGADGAIGRSWKLTQGAAGRILLIIFVAGLITLPFFAVAFAPLAIAFFSNLGVINQETSSPAAMQSFAVSLGIAAIGALLLFALMNLLVLPFWQSVKAVIYCDLRSRREGLGLQLRDRRRET